MSPHMRKFKYTRHSAAVTTQRIIRKILFIIILCFVIILLSFCINKLLNFKQIEVIGDNIEVKIDPDKFSHNLLLFPAEKIRRQILLENPLISDIKFVKSFRIL